VHNQFVIHLVLIYRNRSRFANIIAKNTFMDPQCTITT